MPQPSPSAPPASPQSFAGLLASFASPGQKKPPARDSGREAGRDVFRDLSRGDARDPDGLEDDVATLSYERALRAHARYHAPEDAPEVGILAFPEAPFAGQAPVEIGPAETARVNSLRIFEAEPEPRTAPTPRSADARSIPKAQFAADAELSEPVSLNKAAGLDRNLKTASITIRLSPSECVQLRQRATAAGLSVSAYMRSCTFETEALRALVKDTLAKMRTEGARADGVTDPPAAVRRAPPGWRELLARLWPYARVSQRVAQA